MKQTLEEAVWEIGAQLKPHASARDKARTIYDWMAGHIAYDYARLADSWRAETLAPEETLQRGKGICTDMTALYIALGTRIGLKAYEVDVWQDDLGESVNHACALVRLPEGSILVDPAYGANNPKRGFDIKHKGYEVKDYALPELPIISGMPNGGRNAILAMILTAVFGGASLMFGINAGMLNQPRIDHEQTENGGTFVTEHGKFKYIISHGAQESWNKALYFIEATKGTLSNKDVFDAVIEADKDNDGIITIHEAQAALLQANAAYTRSRH
jgi:hypothetical protein